MAKIEKWSIQRVFDMTIKNVDGTTVFGTITDLQNMSMENAQENVYSMGGAGNPYISAFSHSKRVTGTTTAGVFDNRILALITGSDVTEGAVTVPLPYEDVKITSDTALTTYTAIGETGSEILKVEILGASGVEEELTQAAIAATGTSFEYDTGTKTLTFFAGDYADGTVARVYYDITTGALAQSITNKSDVESSTVRLEMKSLVKDCNDNEYMAVLIVYKAKLTGNWTLGTGAADDPAVLDMSFEAMKKNCAETDFWNLVVYDGSEVS